MFSPKMTETTKTFIRNNQNRRVAILNKIPLNLHGEDLSKLDTNDLTIILNAATSYNEDLVNSGCQPGFGFYIKHIQDELLNRNKKD